MGRVNVRGRSYSEKSLRTKGTPGQSPIKNKLRLDYSFGHEFNPSGVLVIREYGTGRYQVETNTSVGTVIK